MRRGAVRALGASVALGLLCVGAPRAEEAAAAPESGPKRYEGHGLAFEYEASLGLEESLQGGLVTVSVENDEGLLVMIQSGALPVPGDDYAASVIEGMREGLAAAGTTVQAIEEATITADGASRPGRALDFELQGVRYRFSSYGWNRGEKLVAASSRHPLVGGEKYPALVEALLGSLEVTSP